MLRHNQLNQIGRPNPSPFHLIEIKSPSFLTRRYYFGIYLLTDSFEQHGIRIMDL